MCFAEKPEWSVMKRVVYKMVQSGNKNQQRLIPELVELSSDGKPVHTWHINIQKQYINRLVQNNVH